MNQPSNPPVSSTPSTEPDARIMLTDNMTRSIAGTGPWIRFFAVIGFISVAFMLLGAIVLGVLFIASGALSNGPESAMMLLMSILYFVMGGLYVFPSLYLWQTASAVVRLKRGAVAEGAETALEKQRKFWKFIGIVMIVFLALYPVLIIVVVMAGMM